MENLRNKYIMDALKVIAIHHHTQMTDWEKNFVKEIQALFSKNKELTNHQYNKLMEIKDKY